ncbi:MAG: SMP-30/gluconolactonase/LRE family protein [Bacteroidota bacterium]
MKRLSSFLATLMLFACGQNQSQTGDSTDSNRTPEDAPPAEVQNQESPPRFAIDIMHENGQDVFGQQPEITSLFGGMEWSEGPLWLPEQGLIICSDVPNNHIQAWDEANGSRVWLSKSGKTTEGNQPEPGSNGLILDADGHLVACQHGNRQVARMLASLDDPKAEWEVLADNFEGKRLNSPNDLVYDSTGQLYFTDPPYGLAGQDDDPAKELDFSGVYRIDENGELSLLIQDLRRPNGIGLSPDGQTLYVANSDVEEAIIRAYALDQNHQIESELWTLDLTDRTADLPGLPDGLEVARDGQIFATGPGGLWVITPEGTPLVRLSTNYAVSNVELDTKEEYLYMTSDPYLVRVKLP